MSYKKRRGHGDTRGGWSYDNGGEIGGMKPQAKENQGPLAATRSGELDGIASLSEPPEEPTPLTP